MRCGGYRLAFGMSAVLVAGAIALTVTHRRPERNVRATAPNAGPAHASPEAVVTGDAA
jgi:hypothetical protein